METKITLPQLAKTLAQKKDLTQKDAEAFLREFFDTIIQNVTTDKLVKIKGLGTFKLIEVLDRESVNVNTGERIIIPGHTKLSFMPDPLLKDTVNKPFADFQTVIINDGTSLEEMERIPEEEEKPKQDLEQDTELEPEPVQEEEQDLEQKVEQEPEVEQVQEQELEPMVVPEGKTVRFAAADETAKPKDLEEANKTPEPTPIIPPTKDGALTSAEKWAIALGIILLCLLSYFVGYNRLLSPSESAPQKAEIKKNPELKKDTKSETPAAKEVSSEPKQSETPASEPATPKEEVQYAQVPGGKYQIIGTRKTHVMKVGDYLTKIAVQEYGDKDVARYIVVHNNLRNPDNVPIGAEIKLPELKKME